jgi:hypothetical protein
VADVLYHMQFCVWQWSIRVINFNLRVIRSF